MAVKDGDLSDGGQQEATGVIGCTILDSTFKGALRYHQRDCFYVY